MKLDWFLKCEWDCTSVLSNVIDVSGNREFHLEPFIWQAVQNGLPASSQPVAYYRKKVRWFFFAVSLCSFLSLLSVAICQSAPSLCFTLVLCIDIVSMAPIHANKRREKLQKEKRPAARRESLDCSPQIVRLFVKQRQSSAVFCGVGWRWIPQSRTAWMAVSSAAGDSSSIAKIGLCHYCDGVDFTVRLPRTLSFSFLDPAAKSVSGRGA